MQPAPEALLSPRSVAVVGASDDLSKTAARPLRFLRAGGFQGRVFPISRRKTVLGERAWPSLADLPERPDHAFVLLPTEAAVAAAVECARLGVPVVTLLASGFSEAGAAGAAREATLRDALRGTGTRLLGPNSIGLANLHHRLVLTANAAFAEPELPQGGIFVASQSGSMIGAILSRGAQRGLGFAGLVSLGTEVDLDVGSVCAATLDDPAVTSYLLFLETLRGAQALRDFASGAAARGKPVIAYKLGRSAAAAELAQSHTGALAGENDVADAFLRDCGIARVDTLEGLIEAPALLRHLPIRRAGAPRPRVGVVTTTGGGAAMIVDGLGMRGVAVEGPGKVTRSRLDGAGIDPGHGPILDLTLAGVKAEVMGAALDALLAAPDYDMVIAVVGSSARFQPELAVQPIVEAMKGGARLACFCVPEAPRALSMFAEAGLPAFRTPEACADAIAAAFNRREPACNHAASTSYRGPARMMDEAEAYEVLADLSVPHAPYVVLRAASLGREPLPFPYPVAVKILHADIAHKTDVGGVALGIDSDAALAEAAARIRASVATHRPSLSTDRLLVQAMMPSVGEVLLGYRRDPQVGPIILLAAGGILTEIYQDRSIRMAPVNLEAAREMIAEVRALRALQGYRGRPPGDMEALAAAIVAVSGLAARHDVATCEINPLMVLGEGHGVAAVDAVIHVGGHAP